MRTMYVGWILLANTCALEKKGYADFFGIGATPLFHNIYIINYIGFQNNACEHQLFIDFYSKSDYYFLV